MNIKRLTVLVVFLLIIGIVFVCRRQQMTVKPTINSAKIKIVASFYPLGEFTKQVGGENVEVTTVVPTGVEPHDFEPTAQDLGNINTAEGFIYNGNNFDPWAEKIANDLRQKGVLVLNTSEKLNKADQSVDPHYWLDPVLAQDEVLAIQEMLISLDQAHKSDYQKNTIIYIQKLLNLDQQYQDGLKNCQLKAFVTSHQAFSYLAQRYNLTMINIGGVSPDQEPSAKQLADITKAVKQQNIKIIFSETLVSPRLAQTIAQETGAQTEVLSPIEGLSSEEVRDGKDYISIMQGNLTKLQNALRCQSIQ